MTSIDLKQLFDNIIGKTYDETLREYKIFDSINTDSVYSECSNTEMIFQDPLPFGKNTKMLCNCVNTTVMIGGFEAFAALSLYSDTKNDIITRCIVSIGEPKNVNKYRSEQVVRSSICSYFEKYYGKNYMLEDSLELTLIAWDIDEKKILLYCVSKIGKISLQLYDKKDRNATDALDRIRVKKCTSQLNG